MLASIARKCTKAMIQKGAVQPEDEDIHIYGWSLLLSTAGSFLIILCLGFLLGELWGTMIYLLFFTSLRIHAGGYHANSFAKCFVVTMCWYGAGCVLSLGLPQELYPLALAILLGIALLITLIWAPLEHPHKPLGKDRAKYKKISRTMVLLQTVLILSIAWTIPAFQPYCLWAAAGMAITSLSLFYVIIHPYEKGGSNHA